MRYIPMVLVAALVAAPLAAQTASDSAVLKATQRVLATLGIPKRADEIRRAGVPDSTVRSVLSTLMKEKVPAPEAEAILRTESEAAAERGPTDNFGAFVQQQLAAGKRGQELAAAIHAEHARRGKGRPAQAGARDDDDKRGEKPDGGMSKNKKSDADSARGKRPGNPGGKRPN